MVLRMRTDDEFVRWSNMTRGELSIAFTSSSIHNSLIYLCMKSFLTNIYIPYKYMYIIYTSISSFITTS